VLKLTSRLARLFWKALDRVDYAVTYVKCWAVDLIYGPEPPTLDDKQREADHERLRKAFPIIDPDRAIAVDGKPQVDGETSGVGHPLVSAANSPPPEMPAPRLMD
jgi:hypothetical protein